MKKWVLFGAFVCIGLGAMSLAAYHVLSVQTVERTESASSDFSSFVVLSARSNNGSISVERIDGTDIEVEATIRARDEHRLAATNVAIRESSPGVCEVSVTWPDGERLRGEGADLQVRIPHAAELHLNTTNGDVRVDGFIAMISIASSNGGVSVIGPAHQVQIETTNGTIDLDGIAGPVHVRSTNGPFDISLAPDNPGPVFLMSTNGGGTLEVGPAFLGELFVRTSSGRIEIENFDFNTEPRTVKDTGRTRLFDFGEADHGSRLQTTNGNVIIRSIDP